MTNACAKIGAMEIFKDDLVSKLQRHIVSQQNALIVIHLFSSWFMTMILEPSVLSPDVYVCFRASGTPIVGFYMCRTLFHNLATIH